MAFGFPAYHESTRKFDLKSAVLAAAVENALSDLGWQFKRGAYSTQFDARTGFSVWSYAGERITIQIGEGGDIWVRSECTSPIQCLDWGKNRKNVDRFFNVLSQSLGC
jgi:hypothetical protein